MQVGEPCNQSSLMGIPNVRESGLFYSPQSLKQPIFSFWIGWKDVPQNLLGELLLWIGELTFFPGNLDVQDVEKTVIGKVRKSRSFRHFMSHSSLHLYHWHCLLAES